MQNQNLPMQTSDYLAPRWHATGDSIFSEITRLALKHDAINLGQGAPDFYGPQKLLDAICHQMNTCHNQYSSAAGERKLRDQLAYYVKKYAGVEYDASTEITITCGASEALFCALNAFLSNNDKVIVFEPMFDIYAQAITNTGATIANVPLTPPSFVHNDHQNSTEWTIDWDELDAVASKGFKCIIINTPHNPTGKIFTAQELQKIGQLALKYNAIIISDEVYENLYFEKSKPYLSIASFPEFRNHTIRISSAAKTFGFTGLKIGWACAPAHLTKGLQIVHQSTVFAVNPALQLGLAECLADAQWLDDYLSDQRQQYNQKRSILKNILEEFGFLISDCDGTFFLSANYKNISNNSDSLEFAKKYIKTNKIATIPLAPFYLNPPKNFPWIRFAFCKTNETLFKVKNLLK